MCKSELMKFFNLKDIVINWNNKQNLTFEQKTLTNEKPWNNSEPENLKPAFTGAPNF